MSWENPGDGGGDDPRDDEGAGLPGDARSDGPFEPLGGEDGGWTDGEALQRWPLDWRGLYPRERWIWFERLWSDVCMLRDRYRLPVRARWWEDPIQVEALAALSAWTARYDSGEWDDPPGKLALLFDLERVSGLLRDGHDPFQPDRDRAAFVRHLIDLGCQPPPAGAARGV